MQHRLIRVLIHPGKEQHYWAVVARSVSGHSSVDRVLLRGVLDGDSDFTKVGPLLLAVSDAVAEAARRLDV